MRLFLLYNIAMRKFFDFLITILESVVIAIIVVLVLFKFVIYPVEVEGSSMYPTLTNGDRGFAFICTKLIGINRFDVVVIKSDKSDNKLVKRVIGLPGEFVEYIDNELYINGKLTEEDFLEDGVVTNDFSYSLGEDEYLCLGDNREVSRDSRYYGAFNSDEIVTTHIYIYRSATAEGLRQ